MNYYHKQGKIYITDAVLTYDALTENQIQFLIDNPNASVSEVLNCQLVEQPVFNLSDYKRIKIAEVSKNHTDMTNANFDCTLAPLGFDGFKLGYPKSTAVFSWCVMQADIRSQKINSIMIATTKEEVDAVNTDFENKIKPYTAEELFYEYLTSQ